MLIPINNQAYIFLYLVFGGMVIAFVYDLFRVSRKAIRTNNILVYIQDMLFWLVVSIIMFVTLFFCNAGEIRGYALIAILLGAILYELVLSDIIVRLLLTVINVLKKIVVYIYKLVRIPVRYVIRILLVPIRLIARLFKVLTTFFRKVYKTVSYRVSMNGKNFINILKKN